MNQIPGDYDALADRGWTVVSAWLDDSLARVLATTARRLHAEGKFRRAGVGRADSVGSVSDDVRRDEIAWLDRGTDVAIDALMDALESMRTSLNREFFLGLKDFEAHFAIYHPGGFYSRHVDRFRDDDKRTISAVLYLNEEWEPAHGGRLRIFESHREAMIEPRLGTLALFKSDSIEHEVEPTTRDRWSVAIWFRR